MNRFLSLLLIPMFMLGHVWPHSHAGASIVESDGHSLRSHIHVSGGHHHDHDGVGHDHHHVGDQSESHGPETAASDTFSATTDHDSDAVYWVDTDWTVSRSVVAPRVDWVMVVWSLPAPSAFRLGLKGCRIGDPPDRSAGLPIYLLTASLRL